MRKKIFYTLIGILYCTLSFGQSSSLRFQKSYGGEEAEIPHSIISLPDSGYVVVGSTRSYGPGNVNVYIFRTNKYGDTLWTKVLGNGGENAYCVRLTNDQKLIVASTESMLFGRGATLLKLDLNGSLIWSQSYGSNSSDFIYDLKVTEDNGFIAIGNSVNATAPLSDIFIMKTDSSGNLEWGKHYGGEKSEYGESILEIPGNGYIAIGATNSYNGLETNPYDGMLLRINNNGDTTWSKRYSKIPYSVTGNKIHLLNNGDFLISGGVTNETDSYNDFFLARTDSTGQIIWSKQYSKYGPEVTANIIHTNDEGCLIAGYTTSVNETDSDIYLIQTNNIGDTLWTKGLGGLSYDLAKDIISTHNGFAILSQSSSFNGTGFNSDSDVGIMLIDSMGNGSCYYRPLDTMTISSLSVMVYNFSPTIESYCIQESISPPITFGGTVVNWCDFTVNTSNVQFNENENYVFPNPFSFGTTLKINENLKNATLIIYNTLGEKIMTLENFSGKEINLDREKLNNGVYFLNFVQDKKLISTMKLVISN